MNNEMGGLVVKDDTAHLNKTDAPTDHGNYRSCRMECAHCQTDNPSRFRFCGACGQRLGVTVCGTCSFATPLPFAFCGECGLPLDLLAGASSEERKLATVLFADVVGFTSLADGSDPEDTARLIDGAFRQLSEIVVAHGGTIDKYMGDSLMAVFGAPVAHDDDAERGVAAALAIIAADTGLGFSIGVNTGEVMITALAGGSVTVMGDAVNVAARLEKAANHGEVLVGPVTYELTSARISYKERPAMTLKGKREPVEVRQALAVRQTPVPANLRPAPLIGRSDEIEFLLAQWRRVNATGRSALVLLTGDPGVGKSRLLDELAVRVGDQSVTVRSSYPPYGGYGGIRVGGDLVAQLGPSNDPAVQKKVRTLTGEFDPSMQGIDAATVRKEQLWALRRLAEDRAQEQSILVLIEDVHMASTSIDLLTSFVARMADLPILVVLAGRPDGKWLTSFSTANTLRLGPLSAEDANELAAVWEPDRAIEDRLLRWAGGNPLFLRELLAFARINADGSEERKHLPLSLRAVLAARLDALTAAERMALQDFAVIGDTATVEQLIALGGPPASEGITGLTNAGIVRHRPDGTLRITEPLLREVAYSTLARTTRVERHLRMAELSNVADDQARHLARAHAMAPEDAALKVRAASALAAAGVAALDVSRRSEGVAMLRQSLDLGHRAPPSLLRLADALNDGERSEALRVLELIPDPSGDPRVDAERVLVRANALADSDTEQALLEFDDAAIRWRKIGDQVKEGWSHSNKGVALFLHGHMSEADDELVRALELFRAEEYRVGELATLSFRALVVPDHPDVESWLHESLAYSIELGDRSRHLSVLGSLMWHHTLRSRLGGEQETAVARAWIDETSLLAEELGWSDFLLQSRCLRANLARMAGDFNRASAEIAQARQIVPIESVGARALLAAVSLSLSSGSPFRHFNDTDPFTSIAAVIQMETALLEGRFEEIADHGFVPTRTNLGRHQAAIGLVPAAAGLAQCGRYDQAIALARDVVAATTDDHTYAAFGAWAVVAECSIRLGRDPDEALSHLGAEGDRPGGLTGALILRALAAAGNGSAYAQLQEVAARLDAPGLLRGVDDLGVLTSAATTT